MTRIRKMMISILTVAVLLVTMTVNVFAAEEYTYKVTFYVGVQGTFSGEDDLSVTGSDYVMNRSEDKITINGLKAGSVVSFNAQNEGSVVLDTDSKYFPVELMKVARTAVEMESPLEAEKLINRYRLDLLESLRPFDNFSLDSVFYYGLKLKLISRMKQFNADIGESAYKNIYNSIMNGERLEAIQ